MRARAPGSTAWRRVAAVALAASALAARALAEAPNDVLCTAGSWDFLDEGVEATLDCGTAHGIRQGETGVLRLPGGRPGPSFVVKREDTQAVIGLTSAAPGDIVALEPVHAAFDAPLWPRAKRFLTSEVNAAAETAVVEAGTRAGVAMGIPAQIFQSVREAGKEHLLPRATARVMDVAGDDCTLRCEVLGTNRLEPGLVVLFFGLGPPVEPPAGAEGSRTSLERRVRELQEELARQSTAGNAAEVRRLEGTLGQTVAQREERLAHEQQRSDLLASLDDAVDRGEAPDYDYEAALAAMRALDADPRVASQPEVRARIGAELEHVESRKSARDATRARLGVLISQARAERDRGDYAAAVGTCELAESTARSRSDLDLNSRYFEDVAMVRRDAQDRLALRSITIESDRIRRVRRGREQ